MFCLVCMMLKYMRIVFVIKIVIVILFMIGSQINNKNYVILILGNKKFQYKFKVQKVFFFYTMKRVMNKMKRRKVNLCSAFKLCCRSRDCHDLERPTYCMVWGDTVVGQHLKSYELYNMTSNSHWKTQPHVSSSSFVCEIEFQVMPRLAGALSIILRALLTWSRRVKMDCYSTVQIPTGL